MSVVVAVAYHDCAVITSDSRVTFIRNGKEIRRDELRKVFQVADHLAVAFTSDNVEISYKIITELTRYSLNKSRSKHTLFLIRKLPKVAAYHYKLLTTSVYRPPMEFIFVGVINDRAMKFSKTAMASFLMKHFQGRSIPTHLSAQLFTGNSYAHIGPPISIVVKVRFPEGHISFSGPFSFEVSGSGRGFIDEMRKNSHSVLFPEQLNMRIGLLHFAINDYFDSKQISTVGGLNQTVIIDSKGVRPVNYSFQKTGQDGMTSECKMAFENGEWIQTNSVGHRVPVRDFNPLSILDKSHIFTGSILVTDSL